jgi:hypothetical protein
VAATGGPGFTFARARLAADGDLFLKVADRSEFPVELTRPVPWLKLMTDAPVDVCVIDGEMFLCGTAIPVPHTTFATPTFGFIALGLFPDNIYFHHSSYAGPAKPRGGDHLIFRAVLSRGRWRATDVRPRPVA